jgi:hypothetical protein
MNLAMHTQYAPRLSSDGFAAKAFVRKCRRLVARPSSTWLLVCLALACLTGCKRADTPPDTGMAWSSVDSWYRPPSRDGNFRYGERLPARDISEVSSHQCRSAEDLLREDDCVEITPARATELTGRALSAPNGMNLYLVRAVYLKRDTGGFRVTLSGNELLVEHHCMGGSAKPMQRIPLVVPLPRKPQTVFVTCSMTE